MLDIQVLDARNRILGVEHPNTINALANLASTYDELGKHTEAGSWRSKFWMQETEFLEWNTHTQS